MVYEAQGAQGLSNVLINPPTSTEQVLFPEKYLAEEQEVIPPPPVPNPDGDELTFSGTMGAGMLWFLLSDVHGEAAARQLVEQWRADSYGIVEREDGRRCLNAAIQMDTSGAHALFGRAITESLEATGAIVEIQISPNQVTLSACRFPE